LADRAIDNDAEPLAELIPERFVDVSAKARKRVELLAPGEPVRKAKIAWQIADVPANRYSGGAGVEPEERRAACRRPDEAEEESDRRRLAGAVRPQISEDLAGLDTEVEVDERAYLSAVRLRQANSLDGRRFGHSLRSYCRHPHS